MLEKLPPTYNGGTARHHDLDVAAGVRVPRRGGPRYGVDRSDPVAGLPCDADERSSHVHRGTAHRESRDSAKLDHARVPGGGRSGRGVDRSVSDPRLATDTGEGTGDVERRVAQGDRVDRGAVLAAD